MDNIGGILIIGSLAALVILIIVLIVAGMFRKVGPNQALIVYGFGGTRIVQGGGAVVLPMVQSAQELSLELMSFDVAPQQDLYTQQGVAVTVEAVAQIKVKSDPESIRTAAEQFLSKDAPQREGLIRLVMEGHLRGIVGQLTVEQIVKEPEMVADKMRGTCADDLSKMGLEVVSFTIREVRDKNEYISNMGRPDVARIKRDADVAAAEAERDTAIRQANASREAAIARALADQERVIAETASQARQAEATKELNLKRADYEASVQKAQAQADKAYELQTNVQQQLVVAEQVRVQQVERIGQVKVQEAEIARRENELIATVLKAAEIERQRISTLAEAERQKLVAEASGHAEAIRVQGMAEAEIIRAKGQAEAEAMTLRAAAFKEYNQAAILDKLLTGFPEVVRAMAEPLAKVDKITIVSTGNGHNGTGASQITEDMARMIAQAPALFETLSGVKMSQLMEKVPGMKATEEQG
ncbi:MAG TPA: SPFH domain-containing protein [Chloroflexota bacterium]|nr:SPFH domain-containing protein [Chloroflexota bacterium]